MNGTQACGEREKQEGGKNGRVVSLINLLPAFPPSCEILRAERL